MSHESNMDIMDRLKTLTRFVYVEAFKFWRKPVAWVVLALMFLGPIIGEILLLSISPGDAVYPRVVQFLFTADILVFIALATVVLSVLALGNDYELGTVNLILSRGVDRYQFILSKIITTVLSSFIYGLVFTATALVTSAIVHIAHSDLPFFQAAGGDILWRVLGATGVISLINLVLSGIVMLGLVLGRSSWFGMLAGMGYFFIDFFIGGIGSGNILGIEDAYRYTVTFRAISIMERLFPYDPDVSLPRAWAEQGFAPPSQAIIVLILYGIGVTLLAIILFKRQDLTTKS
jgi:ABC-type transport system involved in multi-copper enzyme maturation permease subunit